MKKISSLFTILIVLLFIQGCDNSVDINGGTLSSSSGNDIRSLSEDEDLKSLLKEKSFKAISIDLDTYRYDKPYKKKEYKIDMTFGKNRVTGVADCNRFEANYKVSNDELTFSRVHIAPANDLYSCQEFEDADEAVNAFFSDSYTLSGVNGKKVTLDSENHETSIDLLR